MGALGVAREAERSNSRRKGIQGRNAYCNHTTSIGLIVIGVYPATVPRVRLASILSRRTP
jgi:hypothetical protein